MDVTFLTPKIQQILTQPDVDLSTISAKRVRKQLVVMNEDPQFLRDRKDDVDALIAMVFQAVSRGVVPASTTQPKSQGPHSSTSQPAPISSPQKRKRSVSPRQAEPPSSQPQPLHRATAANGRSAKSDPNSNYVSSDAEYARQLSMELNARSTRGASGHVASTNNRKQAASSTGKKSGKVKSKATVDSDGDDDARPKKKAKGGFGKEYILSDPLAQLVGSATLSRPQAVKKLWEHIKANDLQNPKDKREILCDDKMKAIFKADRVNMFKMNKILGEHLSQPGE